MIQVPEQFRPHIKVDYPPNNRQIFEEWFYEIFADSFSRMPNAIPLIVEKNYQYLPVFWTSYYVNHDYGKDKRSINELQGFINSLDKSRKYFTIVQYDDGILNDLSGLDIKVFGMGGGHYDYPLPLICQPHPYSFTASRDIFCNFMGALTHPIRRQVMQAANRSGYFVSTSPLSIEQYCLNLSRSVFTLCPRGYGLSSFRLMEAIQYGSIPVYVSDKFMIPHNVPFDYGVLIKPKDIPNIDQILKSVDIKAKQEMLPEVFKNYYTYEACQRQILRHI